MLQSPVCWRALGLASRAHRNYSQTLKCFRHCLKLQPDNVETLRDLSVVQIHTRDLEGYKAPVNNTSPSTELTVQDSIFIELPSTGPAELECDGGPQETRHTICQLKPGQRASWSGLALSYHLTGDCAMASTVLQQFRASQQSVNRELVGQVMREMFNKKTDYDYEQSELLLYQNMVSHTAFPALH